MPTAVLFVAGPHQKQWGCHSAGDRIKNIVDHPHNEIEGKRVHRCSNVTTVQTGYNVTTVAVQRSHSGWEEWRTAGFILLYSFAMVWKSHVWLSWLWRAVGVWWQRSGREAWAADGNVQHLDYSSDYMTSHMTKIMGQRWLLLYIIPFSIKRILTCPSQTHQVPCPQATFSTHGI